MAKDAPIPVSQPLAAPGLCTTPGPMGTPVGCNPAGLQTAPAARQSPCVSVMSDLGEMLDISSNMGTDQIQAGAISEMSRDEGDI